MAGDTITLTVNGQVYEGWTDARVTRALEHCAADFELSVSEKWATDRNEVPWRIAPFDACVVSVGGIPLITGYVDHYGPSFDAVTHSVKIAGRSKTADIVDCMPDIPGGQFNNYTLDRIVRAVCAPFGVNVMVQADMGPAIPNATLEKSETAYAFIEKLCRLQGILAFDDENGNLVLAQAGTASAAGALVEGANGNLVAASAKLTSDKRFQKYVVLAQAPLAFDGQESQLEVIGMASDPGCPRFRRFAETAEQACDTSKAALRARWRAKYNCGQGTSMTGTVQGWRQNGTASDFWKINQIVPVNSQSLAINAPLLIAKTSLIQNATGTRTEMTLGPVDAFIPNPKPAKNPKGKGTADIWNQAGGIQ